MTPLTDTPKPQLAIKQLLMIQIKSPGGYAYA